MEKSIFTQEYSIMLRLLKETRKRLKVSQVDLAERLGQSQSFVSKCERGERRMDVIQLRTVCHALGTTLPDFVKALETRLKQSGNKKSRR
ncbi:helix-turn-helix domain-containing protein [Gimesia algae]|uniref:Helix-turn-helix domain protein n=1 Tax=Gimesia algae TaxID=2527971 RepID=A0A517VEL9_9PLAN|nr:helix-turn-helix transcriptional regulator [Gimesia algae]QDT91472.1 Helix-turn-helix domain protein [Gimesia algae]